MERIPSTIGSRSSARWPSASTSCEPKSFPVEHASSITRPRAKTSGMAKFREPAVRGAQLLAVSGFALAQPLFDILGKNAEFFAVRGSTPGDIVFFALVVTFLPALVLLAIEALVGVASSHAA